MELADLGIEIERFAASEGINLDNLTATELVEIIYDIAFQD